MELDGIMDDKLTSRERELWEAGYKAGREDGRESAYDEAYTDGHDDGYQEGYEDGYDAGYNDCREDTEVIDGEYYDESEVDIDPVYEEEADDDGY